MDSERGAGAQAPLRQDGERSDPVGDATPEGSGARVPMPSVASGRVPGHRRRRGRWAPWCAAAAAALVAASVLGAAMAGWDLADYVRTYTLTNAAIGLSLVGSGVLIGWQRPRNAVGILLAVGGFGHLVSAVLAPLGVYAIAQQWPAAVTRLMAGVFLGAWGIGLPSLALLALLLFPDGRLPSRRWRPAAWYFAALATASVVLSMVNPFDVVPGEIASRPLLAIDGFPMAVVEQVQAMLMIPAVPLVVCALVMRYLRGDERTRRQLLWLILAVAGMLVVNLQRWITGDGPILFLLSTALIPVAVAIAIVRYQLLDIRLMLSRTLLYGMLITLVIAVYAAVVAVLTMVVPSSADRAVAVAAAVAVAVLFAPLRALLARLIARAMFGGRDDPARVASGVHPAQGLDDVLAQLRGALRMPRLAVQVDDVIVAADGERTHGNTEVLLPVSDGDAVLAVTLRRGEQRLHPADRRTLTLVLPSIALLLRERELMRAVRRARAQTAEAREQERKALHRELHDGLGPVLTGAVMRMDAAANLLAHDDAAAGVALGEARADVRAVLGELRRVVYGLRPVALDAGGLIGALREEARGTQHPLVRVDASRELPTLSPAVELAAYRVVMEALTNARRHAGARAVTISIEADAQTITLTIDDDGTAPTDVHPGVGLRSLRDRVEELGGSAWAGPRALADGDGDGDGDDSPGWRVSARIPLA